MVLKAYDTCPNVQPNHASKTIVACRESQNTKTQTSAQTE